MMSLYLQTEVRSHAPPDTVHCILQTLLNAQEGAKLQLCTLPLLDKSCYIPSKTYTFVHVQVEKLALEKWGGQEKLDAERAKRHEKRLDRERAKAGMTNAYASPKHWLFSLSCTSFDCKSSLALGWPPFLACCDNLVIGDCVLPVVMPRPDNRKL